MTGSAPVEVAITGLGLVTPAGIGIDDNWAGILAGVSAASTDPTLTGAPVDFTCRVPGFDADALLGRRLAWRLDRFSQLAVVAARQAIADAGLAPSAWDAARVGIVLGNSLGGTDTVERQHRAYLGEGPQAVSPLTVPMIMPNMVAGAVSIDCGATGPSLVTATACASGSTAVGVARDLLRAGACDVVLAGGTESALTPATLNALNRMGALSNRRDNPGAASRPFDVERDGFVAAEGAAVLVLERLRDARARSARVRARVAGFGASSDAHHLTAPRPDGAGLARALRAALADARLSPSDVDHVNAHGTSTPLNDRTEAQVLYEVLGPRPVITSTKGVTGHTLAAAGAIEAAYAALSLERDLVPPTANLKNLDPAVALEVAVDEPRRMPLDVVVSSSLGFGGHNAALVLTTV
jgi:3-oxoacyl-[acyl-carrier-protein] synthase II